MMIRRLFVGLACAGTLAAQTFIQMSDPQFGMFTKNASFEHETVNLEFVIASAIRLKPATAAAHAAEIRKLHRAGNMPHPAARLPGSVLTVPSFVPTTKTLALPGAIHLRSVNGFVLFRWNDSIG